MPLLIQHRVNRISDLKRLDNKWGVEIDIRSVVSQHGLLHLSHDPWVQGDSFENWLDEFIKYKIQGPIILNTKEDGLEESILTILKKKNVENYFFLDTALPTLVKWTFTKRINKFALRLSQYEPASFALLFKGVVDWVWVDCFNGKPVEVKEIEAIKNNFKICLVSPELQGFNLPAARIQFSDIAQYAHAICTKYPEAWNVEF